MPNITLRNRRARPAEVPAAPTEVELAPAQMEEEPAEAPVEEPAAPVEAEETAPEAVEVEEAAEETPAEAEAEAEAEVEAAEAAEEAEEVTEALAEEPAAPAEAAEEPEAPTEAAASDGVRQRQFLEIDCILVDKVYDFCFEEDTGLQHCVPIPSGCRLPDFATATCNITNVECTAGTPVPTGVDGLSTVRVTVTITYETMIRNAAGTVICTQAGNIFTFSKNVIVCAPEGTVADCEVRAATCGPCTIVFPPPNGDLHASTTPVPSPQVCCEFNFCLLVETTAPVKILVPTFGFCVPARCQTGGFPPGVCPPSPLFPPQCAPVAG